MELEAIYESDDDDCTDTSEPRAQGCCMSEGHAQKLRGRNRYLLLMTVSLGLLCVVLLVFITLQHISITTERDLLENTFEELNHTISSLQHNNTDLKTEKQQLKNSFGSLNQEKLKLEARVNDLSAQKKQLQRRFDSLNQEKLNLETRFTNRSDEETTASKHGNMCGLDQLFISPEAKSWSVSRKYCRDRGADLVIIKSEEKQRLVSLLLNERMWIGLSDIENEGNLTWVDNSSLNQGFWREGEPNDEHGIEDCVEMFSRTSVLNNWNDLPCSEKRRGICEK